MIICFSFLILGLPKFHGASGFFLWVCFWSVYLRIYDLFSSQSEIGSSGVFDVWVGLKETELLS